MAPKKNIILAIFFFGIFVTLYVLRRKERSDTVSTVEPSPTFGKIPAPTNESVEKNPSMVTSPEPIRQPSSVQIDSMLEKVVDSKILKQTEVRALDSGPRFMRLGLFKDQMYIEASDFHFEAGNDGVWGLRAGTWVHGDLKFPSLKSPLRSEAAESLINQEIPKNSENVTIEKSQELWTVRGNEAVQTEVWRVQYRAPEVGLRRENFLIDVANQKVMAHVSALRQ